MGWTSSLVRFRGGHRPLTGLRRPGDHPGGDLSWCGLSHATAHGFDFRVRLTRRIKSAWLSAHAGVLLIEWSDSEMYTESFEA
jgi:hypothetical protein